MLKQCRCEEDEGENHIARKLTNNNVAQSMFGPVGEAEHFPIVISKLLVGMLLFERAKTEHVRVYYCIIPKNNMRSCSPSGSENIHTAENMPRWITQCYT